MTFQTLGHYRIIEKIGFGGMGDVYRASDEQLQREVAIKLLKPELASDQDRLRRFQQEARAAAALNHENIVAVYDFGVQDGLPYIVSELLHGVTLRETLKRGPISVRQAAELRIFAWPCHSTETSRRPGDECPSGVTDPSRKETEWL